MNILVKYLGGLFHKKHVPTPWWNGYVEFPKETDEIAIYIKETGRVIRINTTKNTIQLEQGGGYLNDIVFVMKL